MFAEYVLQILSVCARDTRAVLQNLQHVALGLEKLLLASLGPGEDDEESSRFSELQCTYLSEKLFRGDLNGRGSPILDTRSPGIGLSVHVPRRACFCLAQALIRSFLEVYMGLR